MKIINPILAGFNPDPSIVRVGEDYYIATSTFEWFPGVQIHHSKDLKNWKLVARPLQRLSQLDMKGNPDSCGVWAPCLSYADGLFYLVYSNVRSFDGVWKDTPNYLVTSTSIEGDWSDPIYLSSRGFDGSMFHDTDGKKWFLSMLVDHRNGIFFGGIEMQEYDPLHKCLIGERHYLTQGSALGVSEGPHLYQNNGYYYLVLAEGGTEYNHAVSIARSKNIYGPYEFHPENPIISAREDTSSYLQKTGHGDLVQTQNGDWYAVFLTGRPLEELGRCILGRETAIAELTWKDGWPYLSQGGRVPQMIAHSGLEEQTLEPVAPRRYFNKTLPKEFQSLRIPIREQWCSLTVSPGYLRLYGKESLSSIHHQSLLARRINSIYSCTTTAVNFSPENFQQMAGLVFYYNTGHYHYVYITANNTLGKRYLSIISSDNFEMSFQEELVFLEENTTVFLRGIMKAKILQFYWSSDDENYHMLGEALDASILSDDYVRAGGDRYRPAFTGCFVGICCQDLATNSHHADFEWFEYLKLNANEI